MRWSFAVSLQNLRYSNLNRFKQATARHDAWRWEHYNLYSLKPCVLICFARLLTTPYIWCCVFCVFPCLKGWTSYRQGTPEHDLSCKRCLFDKGENITLEASKLVLCWADYINKQKDHISLLISILNHIICIYIYILLTLDYVYIYIIPRSQFD